MNSTRDALLQSHLDEFVWRVNYVGVNDPLSGILCCIRSKTCLNTYLNLRVFEIFMTIYGSILH
jgi:hypothetical protein